MRARRFLQTPKGMLLLVLVPLAALAAGGAGVARVAPGLAAATLSAGLLDGAVLRWRKKRWVFPDGALLTGLIVAMVLSPHEPWWVAAVTAVIGIVAKYVARVGTANVFNPAALGLLASYFLFSTGQSWWGALPELPSLAIIALVVAGVFTAIRDNKIPVALAFLLPYYMLFTAMAFLGDPGRVAGLFRAPDVHAALYFAFFMVTDPPTSPPGHRDQVIYGIIVAVVSYGVFVTVGAVYFLLAGLLVANLWEAHRRFRARAARRAHALAS
jgi:Na+-translocating ferredoxin:NAD+ oxidoreductase RnfD subunit